MHSVIFMLATQKQLVYLLLELIKDFLDKEARLGKVSIDVNSQAGTLGEIVIDGEVTVSSGSTLCGEVVDELSLADSFSVPTGRYR